jgi:hypothetical protein
VNSNRSRRSFLGLAAVGAIGASGAAGAATNLLKGSGAEATDLAQAIAHRSPAGENSLPGDRYWRISHQGAPDAIGGYAGKSSVLTGESFPLFVSTTARDYTVTAFRMGWYGGAGARKVWQSGTIRGGQQRSATRAGTTNTIQTDWDPAIEVPTDDWPAGTYLLRLDAHSGAQRYVPVTVRSASAKGKVVLKNSVPTWQAYNTWGGYDLYGGPGGTSDYGNRSLAVSLDRPFDESGAPLFLIYERNVIELAEQLGLPLAYVTSMDIASQPDLLTGASALISLGHDEYWCPPERSQVTAARDAGVNIAFLGANCMFRRTRLAASPLGANRMVICYKTSYLDDPMYGKDDELVTSDWREPPVPDPESSLTGTLYESNPVTADFVVQTPDSWVFHGTGVRKGSRFPGLVGTEYDRVNPDTTVQRPIQVLSHSPLTCRGVDSYGDSAYYTHASGAGVFNAGTMRWVEAITGGGGHGINRTTGRFVRRVTANVLTAFADGPAATRYPAHDNLAAIAEWPGDPIAAQHNLW